MVYTELLNAMQRQSAVYLITVYRYLYRRHKIADLIAARKLSMVLLCLIANSISAMGSG